MSSDIIVHWHHCLLTPLPVDTSLSLNTTAFDITACWHHCLLTPLPVDITVFWHHCLLTLLPVDTTACWHHCVLTDLGGGAQTGTRPQPGAPHAGCHLCVPPAPGRRLCGAPLPGPRLQWGWEEPARMRLQVSAPLGSWDCGRNWVLELIWLGIYFCSGLFKVCVCVMLSVCEWMCHVACACACKHFVWVCVCVCVHAYLRRGCVC